MIPFLLCYVLHSTDYRNRPEPDHVACTVEIAPTTNTVVHRWLSKTYIDPLDVRVTTLGNLVCIHRYT